MWRRSVRKCPYPGSRGGAGGKAGSFLSGALSASLPPLPLPVPLLPNSGARRVRISDREGWRLEAEDLGAKSSLSSPAAAAISLSCLSAVLSCPGDAGLCWMLELDDLYGWIDSKG